MLHHASFGDGISDHMSLEDVRGDRNFSPKLSVQCYVFGMEFLADGYNSSESTGAGSVQLRLVMGEAMPLCQIMRPWGLNFGR